MIERIAVFVDGGNFFYLQRDELNWWIDPKRLLDWIGQKGDVVESSYYAVVDSSDNKQMSYFKALSHIGYSLVTKEIKFYDNNDGNGYYVKKGNIDCEIVADIFCMKDRYDTAYIVSGDASFASSLQRLRTLGKNFKVISSGSFIANEMREIAGSHLIDLQTIRGEIEKTQKY